MSRRCVKVFSRAHPTAAAVTMQAVRIPAYYPYRSEAARDYCFKYFASRAAREWPIVSEERMVATSYGSTFVRVSGPANAPPLVLLPGAASTSLMWAPNARALSAEYQTFAVDRTGEIGRSTCTRPLTSVNDLLTWLNELLEALGLQTGVNIAGLSYGGALAALYALHFPKRLNKVVLLAPGNTVLRVTAGFAARVFLALVANRKWVPSLVRWMFAVMVRQDPDWAEATIERLSIAIRSLQLRTVPIPPVFTDAEWRTFSVPTLFLVGEHEVIYSAEKAVRRLQQVAPTVTPEIVAGAGHDLTFVQAAIINQRILDFLKQQPAGECVNAARHAQ